jgi:hypothetical protein
LSSENWYRRHIRDDDVFRDPDNLTKSDVLKSITFDKDENDIFSIQKKLNELNRKINDDWLEIKDNWKFKETIETSYPKKIYNLLDFGHGITEIPTNTNWNDGARKTISIFIFGEKYQLETKKMHRIGDLRISKVLLQLLERF